MESKSYALAPGEKPRLSIAREDGDVYEVSCDGQPVRKLARSPVPQEVLLPDGTVVMAAWYEGPFGAGAGWRLSRDGVPLPGSASDPRKLVSEAVQVLFLIAALTGIVAVLSIAGVTWLRAVSDGYGLIDAAVFAGLAFLVWKRQSLAALIVAIVLFAASSVYAFFRLADLHAASPAPLVVRVVLLIGLVRAVPALRTLRQTKPSATAP